MAAINTGIMCFILAALLSMLPLQLTRRYAYFISSAGAFFFALFSLSIISTSPDSLYSISISPALEFAFYADALSGFFLLVVSVGAFAVSLYSAGYTKDMNNSRVGGALYNAFILSIYAVILSGNIITFLISWETMSILSYFLVTLHRDEESARAGLIYAVMTHVGTAFIIALFFILYVQTGSMDFAAMKLSASHIAGPLKTLIFIFSIIGFGTKAGIIPFHTWLPRAHPAAPSHISALMSGVMIKTGIYGFVRMAMDILGTGPEWWGHFIIILGALSAVYGILRAFMESNLKKFLAYSSIENMGIIFLGLGAAMMFKSNGMLLLSSLALTAALYHTLNHSIFKGLLFLGAGSVIHATHSKNMEDMGGLLKTMPWTGLFFLIASVSICALPPFNGFVSEWLTYQALLSGFNSASTIAKVVAPFGGAALALTGALTAACFVKAFGISFLGVSRSIKTETVRESSFPMISAMGLLALLCLVLGIFPEAALRVISPAVFSYAGESNVFAGKSFLQVSGTFSSLSPVAVLITMIINVIAVAVLIFIFAGKKKVSYGDPWDCGMDTLTPRMQYTAAAFAKPLKLIFRRIYRPRRELSITYIIKPLFVSSIRYTGSITPFFEQYMYGPALSLIRASAGRIKMLQSGSLHLYLGYILATLILLLIWGAW